ncbi:hypothetical protein [Aquicoccus sp.]|uniref:hypothetical protein n=1 Tax=Aquicoccus sp. TaxID=2055851 RepID=UPI003562FF3E
MKKKKYGATQPCPAFEALSKNPYRAMACGKAEIGAGPVENGPKNVRMCQALFVNKSRPGRELTSDLFRTGKGNCRIGYAHMQFAFIQSSRPGFHLFNGTKETAPETGAADVFEDAVV